MTDKEDHKHDEHCKCGKDHKECKHGEGCECGHEHVHTTKVAPTKKNTSGVAEEGNVVRVHYTGTLDDGEEFDTSKGKDPLEFALGAHAVIPGFENALVGMKVGEKKKISLKPEEAYGQPNEQLRQTVPREALGEITPEVGMMLALQHPSMPQPMPAKVEKVTEKEVTLDLNHPLAGKTLNFELELVELK